MRKADLCRRVRAVGLNSQSAGALNTPPRKLLLFDARQGPGTVESSLSIGGSPADSPGIICRSSLLPESERLRCARQKPRSRFSLESRHRANLLRHVPDSAGKWISARRSWILCNSVHDPKRQHEPCTTTTTTSQQTFRRGVEAICIFAAPSSMWTLHPLTVDSACVRNSQASSALFTLHHVRVIKRADLPAKHRRPHAQTLTSTKRQLPLSLRMF